MLAPCREIKYRRNIMSSSIRLILYSKPGCHLCEGLQEKLESISSLNLEIEVRDITTRQEWFQAFQYDIPVLFYVSGSSDSFALGTASEDGNTVQPTDNSFDTPLRHNDPASSVLIPVERPSPRASVSHVEKLVYRAIAKAE